MPFDFGVGDKQTADFGTADGPFKMPPFGSTHVAKPVLDSPPSFGKPNPVSFFGDAKRQADQGLSKLMPALAPTLGDVPPLFNRAVEESPQPVIAAASTPEPVEIASPVLEVLYWRDPMRTALFFATGILLFGLGTYALYGDHSVTLVTAISYAAVTVYGVNFVVGLMTRRSPDAAKLSNSTTLTYLAQKTIEGLSGVSYVYDRFLLGDNPSVGFVVLLSLWSLSYLGAVMSLWTLLFIGYLGVFTVPATLHHFQVGLNTVLDKTYGVVKAKVQAYKLNRYLYVSMAVTVFSGLFFLLSWANVSILALATLVFIRGFFSTTEVERFRTKVEPLTNTVRKASRQAANSLYSKTDMANLMNRFSAVSSTQHQD